MSDIVWGDRIEVNGKRPEWLDRDELILCNGPRCASSNLWAATTEFRLPADHGYYSRCGQVAEPTKAPDDWQPCERTVRACIEAMRCCHSNNGFAAALSVAALEALLPKPDPAEALLVEFHNADDADNLPGGNMAERAIRWLINTERLRT